MTLTLGCHKSSCTHLFGYMYTYIYLTGFINLQLKYFHMQKIKWTKGEGSRTTRIGLVNRLKIKVNEQKRHSAFLCAGHFYFQDRHLFSCVDPLLLCYRVLNMGRVALFWCFFPSFLSLWSQIWQGAHPPYKTKFWQCWDLVIPFKIL